MRITSLTLALLLECTYLVQNVAFFIPRITFAASNRRSSITMMSDSTSKLSYSVTSDLEVDNTLLRAASAQTSKRVYLFHEGDRSMVSTLGGKGANLAEMASLGLPVPPGFTISTNVRDYRRVSHVLPAIKCSKCIFCF